MSRIACAIVQSLQRNNEGERIMKQTVQLASFRDAFRAYGRAESFSRAGLGLIFGYIESVEADTGEQIELDVVAICCDFNELDFEELKKEYDFLAACEGLEECASALRDHTSVIGVTDSSVVFQVF